MTAIGKAAVQIQADNFWRRLDAEVQHSTKQPSIFIL